MRRNYIIGVLVILFVAALTVHADDFWVKKEWKAWSKEEAAKMTQDSPWAKKWGQQLAAERTDLNAAALSGTGGQANELLEYTIQLRSALPVREGIVRILQIQQKYDKLTDDQKKSFDTQADAILNRNYEEVILIHVYYHCSTQATERKLAAYWQSVPAESVPLDVYLINEHGLRVPPIKFASPKTGAYEFELAFPRTVKNEPIIQPGDKNLRFQFPHPAVGNFSADTALVEFKLDKMISNGKLAF